VTTQPQQSSPAPALWRGMIGKWCMMSRLEVVNPAGPGKVGFDRIVDGLRHVCGYD
jgi:hypothetical protein